MCGRDRRQWPWQRVGLAVLSVENFGDAPFDIGPVGPETVAAMTLAVDAVRRVVSVPVGVNVLRNDPSSALAIAVATGASFIRVNVHHGAMVADEGILEGRASETLRARTALGADTNVSISPIYSSSMPLRWGIPTSAMSPWRPHTGRWPTPS